MILPSDRINITVQVRRLEHNNLIGGIISNKKDYQIAQKDTTPLINDLEITDVFENKNREEGAGVTDLIRQVE